VVAASAAQNAASVVQSSTKDLTAKVFISCVPQCMPVDMEQWLWGNESFFS
jgi:hypothetical protein